MITLVTPTQGNPVALRRTVDNLKSSFGGLLNEFVVGDLSVFDGQFESGFDDVRFHKLPFNFLFKNGFSAALNLLAEQATNDLCIYLNVGEIVECNLNTDLISAPYNCYSFNHAVDPHTWFRMWDRKHIAWSGRIHEELRGPLKKCPQHLFRMADTPKDEEDDFKAGVYNDIKEMVYFQQYVHLVERPEDLGATNVHWLKYAQDGLWDLQKKLKEKGDRYQAFLEGDLEKYRIAAAKDQPSKIWSKP